MFAAVFFCGLLSFPAVRADGWDDFSNNLASDLAPILSLFGEQVTKQYLSESITLLDYFIFAMAPMGILTAIVSAIRVCGTPSLRAFIGRAQEGGGSAEAELCSSTSRDVCELYNNGGIVRVFGRPKILEVVHDPVNPDLNGTAGIYTFQEYLRSENGEKEWEDQHKDRQDIEKDTEPDAFAPNLSLNVGIKRQSPSIFWMVALSGLALQTGVLVFAAVVTYQLRWNKDGNQPESYACPLVLIGTLFMSGGTFLCAFLIGQSTEERIFRRISGNDKTPQRSSIYWVQPGGQVLGDQVFDSFCCSDHGRPLNEYITSGKNRSGHWAKHSKLMVWAAVSTTICGFILQFVGLRGIHSAVSIAQLGATMMMSAMRAGLRLQRLKPEDNFLHRCPDEVVGHELDWLAMRIGREDIESEVYPSSEPALTNSSSPKSENRGGHFWRFCGTARVGDRIKQEYPAPLAAPNAAQKLLAYRTRLAQLTQAPTSQSRSMASAKDFNDRMVEVRESAKRLALAIESASNIVFSKSPKLRGEWEAAESMYWGFVCDIGQKKDKNMKEPRNEHTIYLRLVRDGPGNAWKFENKLHLEAILGLWVWSLKSDPAVEISDRQSQLTLSRATEIPAHRIISTNQQVAETELKMWLGREAPNTVKRVIPLSSGNTNSIWTGAERGGNGFEELSGELPEKLEDTARLFGWYATELPQQQSSDTDRNSVWSASTNQSLLSLCTQEVFGSFIRSVIAIVDDFGNIDVQQEVRHFRLENSLVSELITSFTESQLGSRMDALLCILPPIISSLTLSSAGSALSAARKSARQYRKQNSWSQADTVLKWAWQVCCNSQLPEAGTDEPFVSNHIKQAVIALGELYRWALMGDSKAREFGFSGIKGLSNDCTLLYPKVSSISDIASRYSDIAERVKKGTKDFGHDHLLTAMKDGLFETLLSLTLPTPVRNEDLEEALCLSVKNDWAEVVLALLELGAQPDSRDVKNNSKPALSLAVERGSIEIVETLLQAGAFADLADTHLRTPLSFASEIGHKSIIERLLKDERVAPDTKDETGQTPLYWAARGDHGDIVEFLLSTGQVDPNTPDNNGHTPLAIAAENGHKEVIELLLSTGQVNPNTLDKYGYTPLAIAAAYDRKEVIELLFSTGQVDPNTLDNNGYTPLAIAANNGCKEVIELLLSTGQVDPNTADKYGRTLLAIAAENGYKKIIKLLLSTGQVDPNTPDKYTTTPLAIAAENGHKEVIELLLSTGQVNPNTPDKYGYTPLAIAAENGHKEVIELLLSTGQVDPNTPDNNRYTPLAVAANNGHKEVIKLLLSTCQINPNTPNEYATTPLALAAKNGHKEVVQLLLGADNIHIDTENHLGETPLSLARDRGHSDIVELLLEARRRGGE